jgi:hypothetical protein
MLTHKLSPDKTLQFILAGHSIFTIRKIETGGRFTYRVTVPEDQKVSPELATPSIYFVSVLTGSDNTSDYSYIGYIRNGKFTYGNKSRVGIQAPSVRVFDVVFNQLLMNSVLLTKIEIWHEGRCGRCGRTLTVPESIESGYGSECIKYLVKSITIQ